MTDHQRGCEGRTYTCTCGYDAALEARAEAAEAKVAVLRKALEAVPVSASLGKQCKMCGTFAPEAFGVSCPRPECEYRAHPPKEPENG